jgi:hypothetical protein
MDQHVCPKCSGEMIQGFVMDKTKVTHEVAHWLAGSPQRSFWAGTKMPEISQPMGAFRCTACGYVEFYAGPEFEAE